ncbi:unnamed protein product [Trichogramma brassicae]|uniref:Uncharacterized protein n=1 Tax=Trichogramma brassicae TaxID=86971 RepID=A0A6H5J291_9HYME|nr:unnamed protein product [Trichogramma brassicae]
MKNLKRLDVSEVDRIIKFVINTGYKDKPDVGKDGKPLLRRTTAIHWAARGEYSFLMKYRIRELLKIYKVDVNYTDDFGLSHFHVACQYDCHDDVVEFLKFGQDPNCLVLKTGASPLHLALRHERKRIVELLLRRGSNPNLANKDGSTPLHTICSRKDSNCDLAELFFKICDDVNQPVQVDARDKSGNTPLHAALQRKHFKVVELLLTRGANANSANEEGSTPLHNICNRYNDDDFGSKTLDVFLDINAELDQPVQLDVQDKKGDTPLHLALKKYNKKMAVLLLKYGASPNLTNEDGRTPLHIVCSDCWDDLARTFLKTIDDMQQTVEVDARDKKGWTPLHVALVHGDIAIAELLLKRGADQNSADMEGLTPLHIICKRYDDDYVAKTFFEINQKLEQTVQVDALDKKNRTPLQYAVTNSLPNVVDVILDHGADLSNFVFPIEDDFEEIALVQLGTFNLDRAFRTLDVIERLGKRGYVLDRIGALTIMKLFAKSGLNNRSKDLDEYLRDKSESFIESVKTLTINPTLSVYDLIRLPGEEASKLCTIEDSLSLVNSDKLKKFPREFRQECKKYLCEMIHGKFCRRWALEFFLSLTRHQLPILCCDIIIRRLTNVDLLNMCLAAENM